MRPELLRPLSRHSTIFEGKKRAVFAGVANLLLLATLAVGLAACGANRTPKPSSKAHINNKTKFSVKEFGVAASPRVTTSRKVRRGGGRAQVGKRYKVRGKWYYPREQPGYNKVGNASWYGPNFHGRLTANGEIYDQYALSGAHPTFPLPSYARVTNLANGNSVVVRVNDRGPYSNKRIIDMSARAAELLDYKRQGIARVRVQYIGKARLDGRDQRFLVASYKPGKNYRRNNPVRAIGGLSGVLTAGRRPPSPVGNVPVFSFVKAPYPKERPLVPGGIPVIIGALSKPVVPPAANGFDPTSSEPFSPEVTVKLKRGFIVSSYAVGIRISNAHRAASKAFIVKADRQFAAGKLRKWKLADQ